MQQQQQQADGGGGAGTSLAEFMLRRGYTDTEPLVSAIDCGDGAVKSTQPKKKQQAKPPAAPALTLLDAPPPQSLLSESCMSSFFMPVPITHPQKDKEVFTNISRYGRIYKRKKPSQSLGHLGQRCPPGTRYCTHCRAPQPLEAFYTQSRRYICRKHHYERVKARIIMRFSEEELAYVADNAWLRVQKCWPLLGSKRLNYDAHDFMDLLSTLAIPLAMDPIFVPIDPARPLRPRNVAIITRTQLNLLVRIAENTSSRVQHIMFVQACNLVPRNADVGIPWNPFHDPDYQRVDIDLVPIIEAEKDIPLVCPTLDWMQELKRDEAQAQRRPLPELSRADGFPHGLVCITGGEGGDARCTKKGRKKKKSDDDDTET